MRNVLSASRCRRGLYPRECESSISVCFPKVSGRIVVGLSGREYCDDTGDCVCGSSSQQHTLVGLSVFLDHDFRGPDDDFVFLRRAAALHQKHGEVRGERLSGKLPHH
jgi:hypothetical protein